MVSCRGLCSQVSVLHCAPAGGSCAVLVDGSILCAILALYPPPAAAIDFTLVLLGASIPCSILAFNRPAAGATFANSYHVSAS